MALTTKQEKYVQNLVKGMSQREAYKNSYDASKMKDETIDSKASILFKEDKIRARYEELIKKTEDETIMSAKERKRWLTDVIKGKVTNTSYDGNGNSYENEAYISDKMKAVDILNKMDGEYIEKVKLSGNVSHQEQKNAIDDIVSQMKPISDDDV